ncbi:MAG: NAD(+) kinase [Gammaproteobacteria bacterium]|jgi:NAD+ kinase|nr:NAD(+) kinase [Gammaproteobacteria bacterium]
MSISFRNIVIVGNPDDARVAEPMVLLSDHLKKAGANLLPQAQISSADLVMSIGGDGTMLYASRLTRESGTPILGINRGRLGFLADVTPDELISSVDNVLDGNFTTDSRLLLEARLHRKSGDDVVAYALNDIVLQRRETGRMVDFETRVAGQYVNTHSGDGLIVATPTGSTAYALSCGGPIIEPQLDAVVIVPVCPHTLTDRPIVVSADQSIEVTLLQRDETKAEITVDGFSVGDIKPADKLRISAANSRVTLVHPPGYDFYGILRSKLFWGRDNRKRDV